MDEAWNPKARVGPLIPKTDRPTREGTKKQAVEKGLEAAAAKRAGMPVSYSVRNYNEQRIQIYIYILFYILNSSSAPSMKCRFTKLNVLLYSEKRNNCTGWEKKKKKKIE